MFQKILYIALAGACGTLARYWLSGVISRNLSTGFPLGTLIINITGCLAFGLLWGIIENRLSVSGQLRTIIFVGFFGAFTTFSSLAFETAQLLDESQWLWASANIVLQNAVGLIGMIGGLAIGKYI